MSQQKLPGWTDIEERWDAEELAAQRKRHEDWAAGILRGMVRSHPPSSAECELMMSGIRIDRFVSDLECERCNLDTHDHTLGFLFTYWSNTWRQDIPIKFCLKDFYRKYPGLARAMSKHGE